MWPAAAGVGVFIGLVMTLLKRRRPDDDEEGILTVDDEDTPSPSADPIEEKVRKPWPWAKIGAGFGLAVMFFVVSAAIYSFFSIAGMKASQDKLEREMAAKVNRGSFDSLDIVVRDLKSATEELTTKVDDARGRLKVVETKLGVVEREVITVGKVADGARSIASRAATKIVRLDEKVTRETNDIKRVLTTHSNLIRTGFARQDSINVFLASRFSISQAEMDSLASWFPKKQNVQN